MSIARLALLSNAFFVVLLVALHIIRSDVDPSWHFISEYAIGRNGWIMQLAFLCLAVSNLTTWMSIRMALQTRWGSVGSFLFLTGTFGLVLAAIFIADPVNTSAELQTTSGQIHNLGGVLGLLGFIGTLIMSARLIRTANVASTRTAVWVATAVLVIGFLVSFIGIASLAAQHNGVFSPETAVGWPNRIGILSACIWLAIVTRYSAHFIDRRVSDPGLALQK